MSAERTDNSKPKPATRRWRANLALAGASVVVTLVLAEIALRILGLGKPPEVMLQGSTDIYIKSAVEGLEYEFRPGFEGFAYGCNVKVNSLGMRAPERPLKKPAGTRRVLLLGDSVTFGQGVGQSEIVSARLEEMLRSEAPPGETIEVHNAAVPGYNARQQYLALREKRLALEPDVVVVISVINDLEPAYRLDEHGHLAWDELPEVYEDVIERDFAVKGIAGYLRNHVRLYGIFDRAFRRPFVVRDKYLRYNEKLYADNSPAWLGMQESIRAMRALCEARGSGFVLAYSPIPTRPEPDGFLRIRGKYAAFASQEGIPFIDLGDAFSDMPVKRYTLTPFDQHPNAYGHRVMAESIAPLVAAELKRARHTPERNDGLSSSTAQIGRQSGDRM